PQREAVSEFELAEAITFGLVTDLKMKVHNFQLLPTSPFLYASFKHRVAAFDENLPCRAPAKAKTTTPAAQGSSSKPK
ncbi:hypothetical protein VP01_3721g1, partial [Puccinia sorghi]